MGMDFYIYKAKDKHIFETDNWYSNMDVSQVLYARKWWSLVENVSFLHDYESGEFVQLSKDNIEEMIKVACEYPDYWGDYNNVPALCRMRDTFHETEENGYHYFLEYDW